MMLALARVSALRVLRTRRAWLPIAFWSLLAIVSASSARWRGSVSGADHVMRGVFGAIVLPLVAYLMVGAAVGGSGLKRGIRGVVALGATPLRSALASILVAVLFAGLSCGLLAPVVCALAHGSQDPPLARDLVASLWIGTLAGAAYGAYFSAGSAIGRGTARGVFLAIDWVVGAGAGAGALVVPRGHVQSLLGGVPVADFSQRASSGWLVCLAVAYGAIALVLARRR